MVEVLFLRLMRSLPLLCSTLPFGVLFRRQLALSRLDGTSNHFGNSTSTHHRERPPLRRLDSVLRYALPLVIHGAGSELRARVAQFCGLSIPRSCAGVVLVYAHPVLVHHPKIRRRENVSGTRGTLEQGHSSLVVLRDAFPVVVHKSETSLGLRIAACRRSFKCSDRWGITLLVVQP